MPMCSPLPGSCIQVIERKEEWEASAVDGKAGMTKTSKGWRGGCWGILRHTEAPLSECLNRPKRKAEDMMEKKRLK